MNTVPLGLLFSCAAGTPMRDGPWKRLRVNPVLKATEDPELFDSVRVDDACSILRHGCYSNGLRVVKPGKREKSLSADHSSVTP